MEMFDNQSLKKKHRQLSDFLLMMKETRLSATKLYQVPSGILTPEN